MKRSLDNVILLQQRYEARGYKYLARSINIRGTTFDSSVATRSQIDNQRRKLKRSYQKLEIIVDEMLQTIMEDDSIHLDALIQKHKQEKASNEILHDNLNRLECAYILQLQDYKQKNIREQ